MTILIGAYGRKYNNKKDVIKDYVDGKDFIVYDVSSQWHCRYCSIRDFQSESVEIRYGKMNEYLTIFDPSQEEDCK